MAGPVTFLLSSGSAAESTATAIKLAERILARGHRVAVFAHDEATTLTAGDGEAAQAISALIRRGLHGATLDWVVDSAAARRLGVADNQIAGVVPGDHADLWAFVRESAIVLSPGAEA